MDVIFKFHSKYIVDEKTGCWLWTSKKGVPLNTYGSIRVDTVPMPAHRFSYDHFNGAIPDGMLVCHKCDTPPCVNPDHLFLGSYRDNAIDKVKKGRCVPRKKGNVVDYPYRKNVGFTQEQAERLANAVDKRAKSEPYLIREFFEDGLSSWEAATDPTNEEQE